MTGVLARSLSAVAASPQQVGIEREEELGAEDEKLPLLLPTPSFVASAGEE